MEFVCQQTMGTRTSIEKQQEQQQQQQQQQQQHKPEQKKQSTLAKLTNESLRSVRNGECFVVAFTSFINIFSTLSLFP